MRKYEVQTFCAFLIVNNIFSSHYLKENRPAASVLENSQSEAKCYLVIKHKGKLISTNFDIEISMSPVTSQPPTV